MTIDIPAFTYTLDEAYKEVRKTPLQIHFVRTYEEDVPLVFIQEDLAEQGIVDIATLRVETVVRQVPWEGDYTTQCKVTAIYTLTEGYKYDVCIKEQARQLYNKKYHEYIEEQLNRVRKLL
jgi:hypothetical protein